MTSEPTRRTDPDVSILVPVFNEARHLAQAIATMRSQQFDGVIEFLMIDGRSTDGTAEMLADLAQGDLRIKVLDNPSRITPNALNIGLSAARGRYVVRMDAHSYYPPHYVAKGVERMERGDVEFVSGAAIPYGLDKWSRRVALAMRSRLGTGGAAFRRAHSDEIEVDSGPFGVWRRSSLEALGGWDEAWPVNQDAELAARIRKGGGRLVCIPDLNARYLPRNSLGALARQYGRFGFYRAKTSRRHPESLRLSHALPPLLVLACVAGALAPHPARRASRAVIALYLTTLCAGALGLAGRESTHDAVWAPLIFATMHVSWGAGFIAGWMRFSANLDSRGRSLSMAGRLRDRRR